MKPIVYDETPRFARDLKDLLKRFRSLRDDLEVAKRAAIELFHATARIDTGAIEEIPSFCTPEIKVCKLRKFACRALKGSGVRSGIRIVYAFHVITRRVVFIEMYFKGDQELEDDSRIKAYLKDNAE